MAIDLAEEVYILTDKLPEEEKYGLKKQLRRAAVSISSNLAEGSSRYSYKEKVHFTAIAFGSLMEVISQLVLAKRFGWISEEEGQVFRENANRLAFFISKLRESQQSRVEEPYIEYQTPQIVEKTDSPLSPYSPVSPISKEENNQNYFKHHTAIIDEGAQIGQNTKIWHFSHIMGGAEIGSDCNIGQNVFIASGAVLRNNVKVQNNVSIYEGVTCEDDVFLGPSMVFTNVINPRSAVNRKKEYQKTHVGQGASIGANATIICGNNIGQYAFVGAGAVVTEDVPDFTVVVGNPAEQIGWMSKNGQRLLFDEEDKAVCPEGKETYVLVDDTVEILKGERSREAEADDGEASARSGESDNSKQ